MRLKDKVAIVTGSGRGLGQAYAVRLAQEGAKVTVCDVIDCSETAKAVEAAGGEVLALKTDVTSAASTVEMAQKTVKRFGRIDILVNNAAIYGGIVLKPFHEIDEKEWDKVMTVNVKGTWLCCKAVFPYMKQQGKGKIINISSSVHFKGVPFFLHYSASKGGVVAMTRALARELGQYNINVNSVAPGLTLTQAALDMRPEQSIKQYIDTLSIKRGQQPDDLTGAIVFLASDDSDF
ncbi:MAG: 3-oxoacyl-ACP reductase family protein, partial [Chloroflexota bacterium]|nr:3-oxoacyl-ACP reductase family protein [Chloroflexota bacterium]